MTLRACVRRIAPARSDPRNSTMRSPRLYPWAGGRDALLTIQIPTRPVGGVDLDRGKTLSGDGSPGEGRRSPRRRGATLQRRMRRSPPSQGLSARGRSAKTGRHAEAAWAAHKEQAEFGDGRDLETEMRKLDLISEQRLAMSAASRDSIGVAGFCRHPATMRTC